MSEADLIADTFSLWALLSESPAARRALRACLAQPEHLLEALGRMDAVGASPPAPNGSVAVPRPRKRRTRKRKSEDEPQADDEVGRSEVLKVLGISGSWFQKLVGDAESDLGKKCYKVGTRWKIKRADLVELAKQRTKAGLVPPPAEKPKSDRPW